MEKPLNLYETSWQLFGARNVLMNLHDQGLLILDPGSKKKPNDPYNNAAYELLMRNEDMLLRWLASPSYINWGYCDFQNDKKGKLVKCKAYPM